MDHVPVSTKIWFGFGEIATATKGFAMGVYLFFYYNQVLGLKPAFASLALGIAIVFDGINDPMVGSISDNLRSRLGRRHPLMWLSLLPLCFTFYFLFQPPEGLAGFWLFVWLTGFAILSRSFMTLFQIPHTAFGAELSTDYGERSRIMSYQTLFGWIGGVGFSVTCYTLIFARTEDMVRGGLLNPDHYFEVAALGVILIFVGILVSTALTQKEGRELAKVKHQQDTFGFIKLIRQIITILRNGNFRIMFSGLFVHGALAGTAGVMGLHMQTYFWGLVPSQIFYFSFSGLLATFGAFALIQIIASRFEKKRVLIFMAIFGLVDSATVISLRLLGWFPENGDPILLPIIVTTWTLGATAGGVAGIMHRSMIADIVDENELTSGLRQEGIFFSSIAFSGKAVSGIGTMVGGIVLSIIDFPVRVESIASVSEDVIFRMGIFMGPILAVGYIIPIIIYNLYDIDKKKLTRIQEKLKVKRARYAPMASKETESAVVPEAT